MKKKNWDMFNPCLIKWRKSKKSEIKHNFKFRKYTAANKSAECNIEISEKCWIRELLKKSGFHIINFVKYRNDPSFDSLLNEDHYYWIQKKRKTISWPTVGKHFSPLSKWVIAELRAPSGEFCFTRVIRVAGPKVIILS